MTLKIAICDDEQNMCNIIEELVLSAAKEISLTVDTEVFYSGSSLCRWLESGNHFNLILLDIEMNGMNGIDVSDRLRNNLGDIDTEIIYVTCTTQYDRKLFDYHPLAFIPKPPKKEQIKRVLSLALRKRCFREPYFSFSYNRETQTIPYRKILYFESDNRKINIVTDTAVYSYYGNLSDIAGALPAFFCQVHRSYVVNLHQIIRYDSKAITMKNNNKISIGKSYREAFLDCQLSELEEIKP